MRSRSSFVAICLLIAFTTTQSASAFLEDLCLPRPNAKGKAKLSWCLNPICAVPPPPNMSCPAQVIEFATIMPGRSMIHADSTYFIALALGYRSDVAYWIAAYNEVTDYAQYIPIDQCGVQAANVNSINGQRTMQTAPNSGRDYITAYFNGFQRTNLNTDGPLDHYTVAFSPNGQGTDVTGAGGVQALYPLHYPTPGYPVHIDDTYQKTLANMRAWGMLASSDPGLLCTVGLTTDSSTCLSGWTITGAVPLIMRIQRGFQMNVKTGPKVLDYQQIKNNPPVITYYDQLGTWLTETS